MGDINIYNREERALYLAMSALVSEGMADTSVYGALMQMRATMDSVKAEVHFDIDMELRKRRYNELKHARDVAYKNLDMRTVIKCTEALEAMEKEGGLGENAG